MNLRKFVAAIVAIVATGSFLCAQTFNNGTYSGVKIPAKPDGSIKFALMSDIHISVGAPSEKSTAACVEDINKNSEIQFVMINGDIANFGYDSELESAKSILSKLKVPWFIIPGNHDNTWSESGTNSFSQIFGYERYEFEAGGYKFIGTPCGPNIRMAPALVPKESMVWLEEQLRKLPDDQPLFFANHYPLDTSLLQYDKVIELLKTKNTQLVFSGHWHVDKPMDYEGLPGVIIRSQLATPKKEIGYVVAEIKGSVVTFRDKIVGRDSEGDIWFTLRMSQGKPYPSNVIYSHSANDFNTCFPNVKEVWRFENEADIGSAAAIYSKTNQIYSKKGFNAIPSVKKGVSEGDVVIFADEAGMIYGLDALTGSKKWSFQTGGKTFSTPAVYADYVVVGSSDSYIYCLNPKDGRLRWKFKCNKSVLGSANIYDGVVYIGASDGIFRAINLSNGKLRWSYDKMNGFVVSRPYVDNEQVVIGDWGNSLYSFNTKTGKKQWEWNIAGSFRNYSPAQVWPVKSKGKIFVVIPNRVSYAIDAKTGQQLSEIYGGREAIGISPDLSNYYIKSMKDTVRAYSIEKIEKIIEARQKSSGESSFKIAAPEVTAWQTLTEIKYDIGPSPITVVDNVGKDGKGLLFVCTSRGSIFALNCADGSVAWQHYISEALINYALPIGTNQLLVSTMDGVVLLLEYDSCNEKLQ